MRKNHLAIAWWALERVRPYEQNPRIIPESAVEKVAASIRAFGWRQPIVVDRRGVIVAGHARYLAAKRLGLDNVPVHVASGLSRDELRAYRLADNRSHDEARWNPDALDVELRELGEVGFDLGLAGFDPVELPGEPPAFGAIGETDVKPLDHKTSIVCPNCGQAFER